MTDNFLSNDNYYNKGGLNGKPREPRPSSPKGQSLDNEYKIVIKQLINERNELRKYIIDICKLLDINTNQSLLGANCLEFYAVLSSVQKDRIRKYKQALDEIEYQIKELFLGVENRDRPYCEKILGIINKTKNNQL